MYVCIYCAWGYGLLWGPEDNLKKLALSFCHLDSRSNSAFRLGGAVLYPRSDFPGSLAVL